MSTIMRQIRAVAIFGLALSGALAGPAMAQAQQNGDPKSCADSGASGEFSDRLNRSGGVICPPDVDQGMKAPTPDAGKMRIIPPPGSPGGDRNVQPK